VGVRNDFARNKLDLKHKKCLVMYAISEKKWSRACACDLDFEREK